MADLERVELKTLHEYPGNARRGDVEAIRASLRANGQFQPLIVQASTRYVLSGNHTLRALIAEGWTEADAYVLERDDEQARRIVLAANRTSDLATYDDRALADLLQGVADFEGTGYDESDLDKLLASLDGAPGSAEFLQPQPDAYTEQYGVIAVCSSEDEQERVFDQLQALGLNVRVVTV